MSKRAPKPAMSPVVFRVIHIILVLIVFVLLALVSKHWKDPAGVESSSRFVRQYYCGIVFLAAYVFIWVLIYFIKLLLVPKSTEFLDIDDAWELGLDALARNGFDLQMLPLFLVVGVDDDQEENVFSAAGFQWQVASEPDNRPGVLRFYAYDDAIFLSCPGVGAMSTQLRKPPEADPYGSQTLRRASPAGSGTLPQPGTGTPDLDDARRTLSAPAGFPGGGTLTPGGLGQTILPTGGPAPTGSGPVVRPLEKLSESEFTTDRRRLEYLCQLIARERTPFCPINGMLVVLPLQWSTSPKMQDMFVSTRRDCETLHTELELHFPVICVFSGLEELAGVSEFIERGCHLNARFRDSRAGSHFPPGHVVDDRASQWVVEKGNQWLRSWIYSMFAKDLSSTDNKKLYRLLCDLSERRQRLVRQLTLTFGHREQETKARLTGCYYCAAGPVSQQRAFLHDVVSKLVGEQNEVAWSESRLEKDHRFRTWANRFFSVAAILAVANVAILLWYFFFRNSPN